MHTSLEATTARIVGPDVFDRPADEVGADLADRRQLLGALADELVDPDAATLSRLVEIRVPADPLLVSALRSDGESLRASGAGWESVAAADVLSPAEASAFDEATGAADAVLDEIEIACTAPALLDGPAEDRAGAPPPRGPVLYEEMRAGRPVLVQSDAARGPSRQVAVPPEFDQLTAPAVSHDGESLAMLATKIGDGEVRTAVLVGPVGGQLRLLAPIERPGVCLSWRPDDKAVLVTPVQDSGPQRLLELRLDGSRREIGTGLAYSVCSEYLEPGRVVTSGGRERDDRPDIFVVEVGGGATELAADDACSDLVGDVAPGGGRVAVSRTCDRLADSGLHVLDISSGRYTRIVAGRASLATWSPNGAWLAFGLVPFGRDLDRDVAVWAVRRDGSGLRRIGPDGSSLPAWLPG